MTTTRVLLTIFSLLLPSCVVFGDSLRGQDVVVTSAVHAPFLSLKSDHTNRMGNDKFEGYTIDLLEELATRLGCKFIVQTPADGKYGMLDKATGSWNGMIGEVVSGAAGMAVADLTITSMRERAVDFTVPFLHVGLTILYKKPSWMSLPFNSVEDLAEQNNIKFGTVKGGSTELYFKNSPIVKYNKIWQAMTDNDEFTVRNIDGLQKVIDGDGAYAHIMESTSVEYHVAKNCKLTQVGGLINNKGYGIALPQGSPYREEVNIALLEMREEGVLDAIKEKLWKKEVCSEENDWTQTIWNMLPSL